MVPRFVLASASPARRRLLQQVGITPDVQPSHFDESQVETADPDSLVRTLALCKAQAVAAQLSATDDRPTVIMGCDSVLEVQGEIHGKPADATEAIARWQQMRGQVGRLFTGHALIGLGPPPQTLVRCQVTEVVFAPVSDRQIEAYVATGEPMHCAGCFALEGKGGLFVEKLHGCHSNVIGLSLPLLRAMLQELGFAVTDFWA